MTAHVSALGHGRLGEHAIGVAGRDEWFHARLHARRVLVVQVEEGQVVVE